MGLEGAEKPEQASQDEQEEEEDLPDEQLAAKTERQLARKGITFEAKQPAKVKGLSLTQYPCAWFLLLSSSICCSSFAAMILSFEPPHPTWLLGLCLGRMQSL